MKKIKYSAFFSAMALTLILSACQQPSSGGGNISSTSPTPVPAKLVYVKGGTVTGKTNENNY
ncbi:MAG: hypothetical protein ACI4LX_09435, partial [Treponema sp.]